MNEKFNLSEMLKEIKEDEASKPTSQKGKASQEMIRKMMMERRKKSEKGNE